MKRRLVLRSAAATTIGLPLARTAFAQGTGTGPLTIVFPYGAGGAVDVMIRTLAEYMTKELKRPVLVDNKPGGNSMIGAEYVSRAKPDGSTLLWAAWPTLTTNLTLFPSIRYSLANFEPITSTFQGYTSLSVINRIPATNFRELVDYAKKNGNQLPYGTLGQASSPHLLMEMGGLLTGVKFELVAYKGDVQGIGDLVAGHIPAYAGALANQVQHHRAKTIRTIAISSDERLPDLPDVPTFKEAGFNDLAVSYWHGVLAPAGTPKPMLTEFHRVISAGMQEPAVKARMSIDQRPMTSSPEAFRALILADTRKWGDLIRSRGIKAE